MSEQLLVGQAVELDFGGPEAPVRVACVVAAMPPREILLSIEGMSVAPPALVPGAEVTLSYATGLGLHQGKTSVLRVTAGRTVNVALVRFSGVTTSNRRQFFRVPASLVVTLVVASSRTAITAKEDSRALTLDISGGGLRVDTVLPLTVGDTVKVTIDVPRGLRKNLPAVMACEAQVVRVEQVVRRSRKVFCAGLQFQFAKENERDKWVQLTFDLQRGAQV